MRRLTLLTLALAAPAFAADSAEAPAALNEALATPAAEATGESSSAIEAAKRAAEAAAAKPANETSYPALSARLDEHYEFRVDGSAESDGMMTFFLKAGLLHYDVHNKDRWSLADNTLTIDISDYTVIRALKPRMAEILAKSPELTAYEEKLFASLNHGSKNGRIRLTVTSHDAQSLQMHDESGNLSECSRPQ